MNEYFHDSQKFFFLKSHHPARVFWHGNVLQNRFLFPILLSRNLTYTLQALIFVILVWMSGDVGRARKTADRGRGPYGQAYSSP